MEKLTSKYKVKVGNHLHTNMLSKSVTMRRREQECRIIGNKFEIKRPAT